MNRLWAPWRIDYIGLPDKDKDCFLCAAAQARDDRQSYVLWREQGCFCVLNCWPYNNGHLLIAPREHKADLDDLSETELVESVRLMRRAKAALTEALSPGGFNIGLNLHRAGGAGLAGHLHWHIVPRWDGDTNFMPVVSDTRVIPQSLEELWELLRNLDGGN